MSSVAEAQNFMRELFPMSEYGSKKASLNEAFKHMTKHYEVLFKKWTHRRVRSIWDGDNRIVHSFELDALREEKARRDAAETIQELNRAADFLAKVDPQEYGHAIDQLWDVAHGISIRGENLEEG